MSEEFQHSECVEPESERTQTESVCAAAEAEIGASPEPAAEEVRPARIWELDAAKGFAAIFMIVEQLMFFLYHLFALIWSDRVGIVQVINTMYAFYTSEIGKSLSIIFTTMAFILASGINATYSRRPLRRGAVIFTIGTLLSAATYVVHALTGYDYVIRFGILQFLGAAMMIGRALRHVRIPWLLAIGSIMIVLGYLNRFVVVDEVYFAPMLNFSTPAFNDMRLVPLVPYLGYFVYGMVLGKVYYKSRTTLFPRARIRGLRPIMWLGKHALALYLAFMIVTLLTIWIVSGCLGL